MLLHSILTNAPDLAHGTALASQPTCETGQSKCALDLLQETWVVQRNRSYDLLQALQPLEESFGNTAFAAPGSLQQGPCRCKFCSTLPSFTPFQTLDSSSSQGQRTSHLAQVTRQRIALQTGVSRLPWTPPSRPHQKVHFPNIGSIQQHRCPNQAAPAPVLSFGEVGIDTGPCNLLS